MGATTALWLALGNATGQGFIIDQASGDLVEPVVNSVVTPPNDIAQSFTPLLNTVGFVQLRSLVTSNPSGGTVALVINLREGAYNGPIISSTDPVAIVGSAGLGTFYFPNNVAVTPGQIYFFQPVVQSPGSLDIGFKDPSPYLSGNLWGNGVPSPTGDLWFREGIVVPEPGVVWLFLIGGAALLWRIRWRS
jgi:hypothetical protein